MKRPAGRDCESLCRRGGESGSRRCDGLCRRKTDRKAGENCKHRHLGFRYVQSNTAETKTLAYGEFVCFTSYDAIGRPDAGTSTYARICTGRITRLYGQYYRLEALTGGGSRAIPQTYTRLYINGEAQDWQAGTETFSYGTDGCVTLPSGLLIQWGRYSPATGSSALPISITFPKKFKTTPLHVTLTRIDRTAAQEV